MSRAMVVATCGWLTALALAQPCGVYWSEQFSPGAAPNSAVETLAVFDDDGDGPHAPALFAGGYFSQAGGTQVNYIAKWDGLGWSALGSGMTLPQHPLFAVYTVYPYDPDGAGPAPAKLIAGGDFTAAGDVSALHVAQWDGATWSALGTGLGGGPYGNVVAGLISFDEDGEGPNPPVLVAAGSFHWAGSTFVRNIAQWDGSSWLPLGAGFGDRPDVQPNVMSLGVYDSDADGPLLPQLYAGGNFMSSGEVPLHGIARWDGGTWSDVGGGVAGGPLPGVFALAVFDDDGDGPNPPALYAAGWFTMAGGMPANNIARWDGTSWSPLGDGVNREVCSLVVFDDDGPGPRPPALCVGGYFTMAGGQPANCLARWDGSSWEPVGGGTNGIVYTLAVFDDDGAGPHLPALFVGGWFTLAGTQPSENIAAWTPLSVPIGDMNCDGTLDFDDINPFVLYLSNLTAWRDVYPGCPPIVGDINCDGTYGQSSLGDINPFIALLTGR